MSSTTQPTVTDAGHTPHVHAGIAETNRHFEAAFAQGDPPARREVYTRNARVMPPGATTVLGREAAAQSGPRRRGSSVSRR